MAEWKNADKATRGPKPRDPATIDQKVPTHLGAKAVDEFNQAQFNDFKENLSQCPNCGRTFYPDRLAVHMRSCKPGGSGSKPVPGKGPPMQSRQQSPPPEKKREGRPSGVKPQFLVCNLCGQQFGTASLAIHQPQCFKKKTIEWERGDPATRGPKPKDPALNPTAKFDPKDPNAIDAFNQQNFEEYNANLSGCPNCGRTFNATALAVHLRSCKPGASGGGSKPVNGRPPPPGAPGGAGGHRPPSKREGPASKPAALVCYLCGQQFGTASLHIHVPQCYKKKMAQWTRADPETRGAPPRDPATVDNSGGGGGGPMTSAQIEEFNNQQFDQFKQDMAQCPNCGRRFLPDRLQVHLRSCKPGSTSRPVGTGAGGGGGGPPNRPTSGGHRSPLYNRIPAGMSEDQAAALTEDDDYATSAPKPAGRAAFGRRSNDNPPTMSEEERYADHPEDSAPLQRNRAKEPPGHRRQSGDSSNAGLSARGYPQPPASGGAEYEDVGPTPEMEAMQLSACGNCGRKFAVERLAKHMKICTGIKKRKVFDPAKMRTEGTEMAQFRGAAKAAKKEEKPKSKWQAKHQAFQDAIKSAKKMEAHLKAGGKVSDLPPPPPSENPDYVQCPHCERRFNPTAAERHIPRCANTINKPKAPPKRAGQASPQPSGGRAGSPQFNKRAASPARNQKSPQPSPRGASPQNSTRQRQPPQKHQETPTGAEESYGKVFHPEASAPPAPPPSKPAPAASGGRSRARFCTECGNKFEDDTANFCQECGTGRD
eukprot:TRINITY_DN12655_c0_g2_i1.p1 TRINITY_DN12655_c0_g2~~TRINITY_DN12655_c0_g2_i1.p1  ORF type:complete len:807 (-),score=107.85 TRINITY_DN12655_c0_g2_i1:150-2441(-)